MSTSGTVIFRLNRDQTINLALQTLGVVDPENAAGPTTSQITNGSLWLNMLVKAWEAEGLQLWTRKYGVIFPQKSQGVYVLGNPAPSGDHACLTTPLGIGGFVKTTLANSASTNTTTISVSSISSNSSVGIPAVSISDTYNIGIQLDSGSLFWTTVSGAPSGTTVTILSGLSSSATAGNTVYCYQTKLMRPLRILDAWVRQVGGNDNPVNIISREHYNRFGFKAGLTTVPSQLYYDPQENTMNVYTYPYFQDVVSQLYIEFQKPIEDFVSSTDDFDLPQEWAMALVYNLALYMAPSYEVPAEKFKQIQFLAGQTFAQVDEWDQEQASVNIQPNNSLLMSGIMGNQG